MGIGWKDFFIGAGFIALSFFLPPVAGGALVSFARMVGFTFVSHALSDHTIEQQSQGALIQSVSTTNNIPIIYGTARVAGKIVWADTWGVEGGLPNERLDMVCCLCLGNRVPQDAETPDPFNGEVSGFGAMFLGEEKVLGANAPTDNGPFSSSYDWIADQTAETPFDGWLGDLGFTKHAFNRHFGAHDQAADTYMVNVNGASPPAFRDSTTDWPWTSDHKLQGIAYIVARLRMTENGMFPPGSGPPNVTVISGGRRLYDPRTGNWTGGLLLAGRNDNASLCIRDYLLDQRSGCAQLLAEIYETDFMAMADISDEAVVVEVEDGPDSEGRRFTCNGVVDTSQSTLRNLQQLLSSGNFFLPWEQGQWRIKRMDTANPLADLELTEHNIIGDWELSSSGPEEWTNLVIANYVNGSDYDADTPDDHVAQVQYPPESGISEVLDDDGGFLMPRELEFPFVNNAGQAFSLAEEHYTRGRNTLSVALTAKEEALALSLFDRIRLTHQTVGMEDKIFYVLGMGLNPDETVRLALKEEENGAGFAAGAVAPGVDYPVLSFAAYCEVIHGDDVDSGSSSASTGNNVSWSSPPAEDAEHTLYAVNIAWSSACSNFDPLFGTPGPGFDCGRNGQQIRDADDPAVEPWRHAFAGSTTGGVCARDRCSGVSTLPGRWYKARWSWRNSLNIQIYGPWSPVQTGVSTQALEVHPSYGGNPNYCTID